MGTARLPNNDPVFDSYIVTREVRYIFYEDTFAILVRRVYKLLVGSLRHI